MKEDLFISVILFLLIKLILTKSTECLVEKFPFQSSVTNTKVNPTSSFTLEEIYGSTLQLISHPHP